MNGAREFVFFWRPADANGYLGNWWPSPYEHEGVHFKTSEHHMMYLKAMLMGDAAKAAEILASDKPANTKKLGQQVKPWDEALWLRERENVMYTACLAKFRAHADLRAQLLATGDATLVEASPMDKIWGIGLKATDPAARSPKNWKGLNLLGSALMRVRTELAAEQ